MAEKYTVDSTVCFLEKKCLMKTIYYRPADSTGKEASCVVVRGNSRKQHFC
jgi:hypothetical protein